jgi:hypothetical protein
MSETEKNSRMDEGTEREGTAVAGHGNKAVANKLRRNGPQIVAGGVAFNLWAPSAKSVELLEATFPPRPMPHDSEGWYTLVSPTGSAVFLIAFGVPLGHEGTPFVHGRQLAPHRTWSIVARRFP